jgi:GT2 family glycosyltransferase
MPFFTIGVTTYKRREYLKQALTALLQQTFEDFEILVGNDYPGEILDASVMGINDPRVRFINHPGNLGEGGNMNALLALGVGKYFTWQADDDLVAPTFLQEVRTAIDQLKDPECVHSSYGVLQGSESLPASQSGLADRMAARLYTGSEFLREYFQGRVKLLTLFGFFETGCLRQMGGVDIMCKGPVPVHCEYMLLVKMGLLQRIGYIDRPLVFFRVNDAHWGRSTITTEILEEDAVNFVGKSAEILSSPSLRADFHRSFSGVLGIASGGVEGLAHFKHGGQPLGHMLGYLMRLHSRLKPLGWSRCYWIAAGCLAYKAAWYLRIAMSEMVKSMLPPKLHAALKKTFGR